MTKKGKYFLITIISIIMLITTFLGIGLQSAFAFSGIPNTLTEQELYNATNTYNVQGSCFNDNGVFLSTTDNDRITNTTQYNITYNMSQKNSNQVMDTTQITVLTHGLGSNAGTWSNHYSATNNEDDDFAYDSDSLISKISDKVGGANIYWARMTGYNSFNLYDITNQTSTSRDYNTTSVVSNITDISKHIIIVFDANESIGSNNNIYYQFNYMLSKIIYDVKVANGGILPKVNLVGHSRGGLTNLQYALDHPDLVSTLVSIGTPYFASTTARLFGADFMEEGDGLNDILNPDVYYGYNARWNTYYNTLYKDIDVYAIGSYHTMMSLIEVVNNDYSDYISSYVEPSIVSSLLATLNGLKLRTGINYLGEQVLVGCITELLDFFFPESSLVDVAEIITQELNYDIYPMFVSWYNDILVPLESQLGNDSGSVAHSNSGSYTGFNDIVRPFLMGDDSVDYEKVSQASPPVGHNLEARDKIIIAEILDVLDLGVNNDSPYVTMDNGDNTVTFVRYRGNYGNSSFVVPTTIESKPVTDIAASAFAVENSITEVQLPNTIKRIGSYAFAGLTNLTTITFTGTGSIALEEIGYGAFAGCTSLNKFNSNDALYMPTSVQFIDCCAFYGTAFSSITIQGNVEYIGDCAFANTPNLTSFTVNNNTTYFSQNGVLYNSDGWLMQYPTGKTGTSFTVPNTVSNVNIRHISQYAFMGENNLTTVNISNITSIEQYAFMGCTNLTTLSNSTNVEYVAPFAFINTPIDSQTTEFITIGKVLYKYNGTDSVLDFSDFPTGITRIASSAFVGNDNLTIINLPNNILDIDNGAFINCPNLFKVIYLNGVLPDIGEYPFIGLNDDFKFYCRKSLIDGISSTSNWYEQSDIISPIATQVYFEDINTYETFYYGSNIELPTEEVTGRYNKGWKRVNETTNQAYGDYLTPSAWNETVATATFRADLVTLNHYTLYFTNGSNNVDAVNISTGDYYEFTKTGYVINGTSYSFVYGSRMSSCTYSGYTSPTVVNGVTVATFEGWTLNGSNISQGQWFETYSSGTLYIYADWDIVQFIATVSDGYSGTTSTQMFNYFAGLNIPDPERSTFRFLGWRNNLNSGYLQMPARITSNISITAEWVRVYTMSYNNLTFKGRTASILLDGSLDNLDAFERTHGHGLDLTRVTAVWPSDGGEYPQLVFLGWYTDMNFTTQVTSISQDDFGAKTYYAKWRYDMLWTIKNRQYTINNSSPWEQSKDQIYVGLNEVCSNGNTLLEELQNIGINNITFNLKIRYWGEGTASVFIYNQGGGELASSSFEATSTTQVRTLQYTISLSEIGENSYIYIAYQASSYKTWIFVTNSHTWYNDKIYLEAAGTVNSSDMSANGGFTWSYNDPF